MKPSVNYHQKNELEMILDLCEKALSDKSGGVIFNKDTEMESRMSYKQALEGIRIVRDYFAMKAAFSFSICKTCSRWNNRGHGNKVFGSCSNGETKHQYETCENHTKNKEAWGL